MKLQFLAYTHEITKNGKTIEDDSSLPTTITKIDELHKYTYEFFASDSYLMNFSASSDIGEYAINNFHIEITKVFPEVPLTVEEFLIYEKEKANNYDLQKNLPLDEDDIEFIKDCLKVDYEEANIDNILAYYQNKVRPINIDEFVYPICSKDDLFQLLENIKTINFLPYNQYDIVMPKELETQLQGIIIEQNIIKNNNSRIEFYNSKNSQAAYREIMLQEDEEETDRLWGELKDQVEYDNLSLGEKISRNVKKIFK